MLRTVGTADTVMFDEIEGAIDDTGEMLEITGGEDAPGVDADVGATVIPAGRKTTLSIYAAPM
jgi:hypothetical protein